MGNAVSLHRIPEGCTLTKPSLLETIVILKSNPCPATVRRICRPGCVEEIEHSSVARLVKIAEDSHAIRLLPPMQEAFLNVANNGKRQSGEGCRYEGFRIVPPR